MPIVNLGFWSETCIQRILTLWGQLCLLWLKWKCQGLSCIYSAPLMGPCKTCDFCKEPTEDVYLCMYVSVWVSLKYRVCVCVRLTLVRHLSYRGPAATAVQGHMATRNVTAWTTQAAKSICLSNNMQGEHVTRDFWGISLYYIYYKLTTSILLSELLPSFLSSFWLHCLCWGCRSFASVDILPTSLQQLLQSAGSASLNAETFTCSTRSMLSHWLQHPCSHWLFGSWMVSSKRMVFLFHTDTVGCITYAHAVACMLICTKWDWPLLFCFAICMSKHHEKQKYAAFSHSQSISFVLHGGHGSIFIMKLLIVPNNYCLKQRDCNAKHGVSISVCCLALSLKHLW